MLLFATLALVMSLHQVTAERQHKELTISTPCGEIRGSIMKTVLGRTIYSFRGIRYAKAPIGNLRFQPPVPINSWNGTYEATKDGAACPQANKNNTSEDCLFLNVYTTKLSKKNFNPRRPVFVFIHPGGYYSMSGMSDTFAPDYFLDQNVVLVAINYRLTSFGFMSTGDKVAPGNNGLKDQVAALRWVKKNIAAFGGDPDLVTIMGYSAGGASVSLHLVSPMSKGLFQRAMIMSGSSFGNWPVPPHQMELAQKQARFVGCPDNNSSVIYECLMKKSVEEITDTLHLFREFAYDPIMRWLPVIEPDCGQERFLTDDPVKLLLEGKFEKVPIMTGITSGEFDYRAWYLMDNVTWLKTMDQNFEEIAPISFIYERNTKNSQHISRELKKFLFGR
ncbi:hypothetical protein FQA39_LY00172 [Lamprigera yunnana]|nr:hypothetical protein FQA39_LY00172 [Lamprigera yunnana]